MTSKLLAIRRAAPRRRQSTATTGILFAIVTACGAPTAGRVQDPPAHHTAAAAHAATMKDFTARVDTYLGMRKTLERGLPAVKPGAVSTGAVETHETALAGRIREARAAAKAGDLFGDAAPYFRTVIRNDLRTRGVADAHAAMQEVPVQSPPRVNAEYPEDAALATVPPLILVNLPRLPEGLEYRFMGRDLILRDRAANLIVDVIEGAVPIVRRR
ncbi:MAG: hypothetical protein AB7J63_11205 [Vicinamibacterales bacterium]